MNDFYEVTAPANNELPVDLEEVKDFLKADSGDDDALIKALMATATDQGQRYTGRLFLTQTVVGQFAALQKTNCEVYPFIQLARAPLVSLTSLKVWSGGSLVDIDTDDYQLKETASYARILFTASVSGDDDKPYPVQATFEAGYGAQKDIPQEIQVALQQHIAFMYENRGDVHAMGKEVMPGVAKAIYNRFRIINTYG